MNIGGYHQDSSGARPAGCGGSVLSGMTMDWVDPTTLGQIGPARSVVLEPLEPRHAGDLHACADPELFRHSMQNPLEWSVRGFQEEMERVKAIAGVVAFAIVAREGRNAGRAIGRTTYMDIKPEHRGLEIGRTWISRAYHGTRVNPEIKYMMLRHAFEGISPPAMRVQITTSGTNLHSQAAIAKLGAVREGVHRKARILPPNAARPNPEVRDWVVYSILDDEWPTVRARLEDRLTGMKPLDEQ